MQSGWRWFVFLTSGPLLAGFPIQAAFADDRPQLSLPLVCQPHKTCFIQTYVDVDPGKGAKDYMCGSATYDQHSGVDFRLLSAAAAIKTPVPVLASADGSVKAIRDGVPDVFSKKAKAQDIAGRECGNGVIIDHGGGWETQYCHMHQGSVRVAKDQTVKRGDQLGDAGFSGMADFAQVFLSVRHDGKVVDPFLPDADGKCDPNARGPGLWEPAASAAFPYNNGEMIGADFTGAPPDVAALEVNDRDVVALTPSSPILVLYGRFINLKKGDRVHFVASGPRGAIFDEFAQALDKDKATYVAFTAVKQRGDDPWPTGHYDGRVALVRDGSVIATNLVSFEMK